MWVREFCCEVQTHNLGFSLPCGFWTILESLCLTLLTRTLFQFQPLSEFRGESLNANTFWLNIYWRQKVISICPAAADGLSHQLWAEAPSWTGCCWTVLAEIRSCWWNSQSRSYHHLTTLAAWSIPLTCAPPSIWKLFPIPWPALMLEIGIDALLQRLKSVKKHLL